MFQGSLNSRIGIATVVIGLSAWVSPALSRSVKQDAAPTPTETSKTAQPKSEGIIVKVDGMTCNSCMNKVKKELALLSSQKYKGKGVNFEVVLTEVKANIGKINTTQMTPQEIEDLRKDIAAAVTKAGYTPLLTDKSS